MKDGMDNCSQIARGLLSHWSSVPSSHTTVTIICPRGQLPILGQSVRYHLAHLHLRCDSLRNYSSHPFSSPQAAQQPMQGFYWNAPPQQAPVQPIIIQAPQAPPVMPPAPPLSPVQPQIILMPPTQQEYVQAPCGSPVGPAAQSWPWSYAFAGAGNGAAMWGGGNNVIATGATSTSATSEINVLIAVVLILIAFKMVYPDFYRVSRRPLS